MTASEFSFLALGLVLGVVTGAALVEFIRARPPAPREVKLTVAHDAIPRRATTLADDAFIAVGPEPARGGPADRRLIGGAMPAGSSERRTTVRFAEAPGAAGGAVPATTAGGPPVPGAIPIARTPEPIPGEIMEPVFPLTGPGPSESEARPMVGIPIAPGEQATTGRTGSERP